MPFLHIKADTSNVGATDKMLNTIETRRVKILDKCSAGGRVKLSVKLPGGEAATPEEGVGDHLEDWNACPNGGFLTTLDSIVDGVRELLVSRGGSLHNTGDVSRDSLAVGYLLRYGDVAEALEIFYALLERVSFGRQGRGVVVVCCEADKCDQEVGLAIPTSRLLLAQLLFPLDGVNFVEGILRLVIVPKLAEDRVGICGDVSKRTVSKDDSTKASTY
jgi:hypothetical protein